MRINIVGSSGSGKTTLGKKLADIMAIPFLEIDAIYWQADWQEKPDELFLPELAAFCNKPDWILEGNYNRTVPVKWRNVDTVVWLDYSRGRIFWQALKRAIKRAVSHQEIWPGTGNRESIRRNFFSRESVLLWSITHYDEIRARYLQYMADPQFSHIEFVQIKNPAQATGFIKRVQQQR